jgi:hypothetical protein
VVTVGHACNDPDAMGSNVQVSLTVWYFSVPQLPLSTGYVLSTVVDDVTLYEHKSGTTDKCTGLFKLTINKNFVQKCRFIPRSIS